MKLKNTIARMLGATLLFASIYITGTNKAEAISVGSSVSIKTDNNQVAHSSYSKPAFATVRKISGSKIETVYVQKDNSYKPFIEVNEGSNKRYTSGTNKEESDGFTSQDKALKYHARSRLREQKPDTVREIKMTKNDIETKVRDIPFPKKEKYIPLKEEDSIKPDRIKVPGEEKINPSKNPNPQVPGISIKLYQFVTYSNGWCYQDSKGNYHDAKTSRFIKKSLVNEESKLIGFSSSLESKVAA